MSKRAFSLGLAFVLTASTCCFGLEPNESFVEATVLPPGVLTTGLQSFEDGGLGITYADTTLGLFSDITFSQLIDSNDDFGLLGDGLSSALGGLDPLPVNPDGSVPLGVSGFNDSDFDGLNDDDLQPHSQSGNVQLILLIWEDQFSFNDIDFRVDDFPLAPGEVFLFEYADPNWAGHFFSAIVDNTIDGGNDVDFWRFTGLPPGALFTAETFSDTPEQDTFMGLFRADTGNLIAENDDAELGNRQSVIRGSVGASGEVVLGVTSFDDFEFIGAHGGFGEYTLSLAYDGDTDRDGDVDGDDLLNLLLHMGTPLDATHEEGDGDRDGDVDRDDYDIFQVNFGVGVPAPGMLGQSAAIPEPTTSALAGIALLFSFVILRRSPTSHGAAADHEPA